MRRLKTAHERLKNRASMSMFFRATGLET